MSSVVSDLVTVIIVNYNGALYIKECLDSVLAQKYTQIEIIVVDNGSKDNSIEIINRYFPEIQVVLLEENRGFAEANFIGFSKSRGEYIALLNNDAVAESSWISELVKGIKLPNAAACGAKILSYKDRKKIDSAGDGFTRMGFPFKTGHGDTDGKEYNQQRKVFSLCGAAVLYRRTIVEKIGFFDHDFFCYLEDVDLALRINHFGYALYYIPSSVVYHVGSASTGSEINSKIVYFVTRNHIALLIKNLPAKLLFMYIPYLTIFLSYWLLYCARRGFVVSFLSGLGDVLSLKNIPKLIKKRVQQKRFWIISSNELNKSIKESEYNVLLNWSRLREKKHKSNLFINLFLKLAYDRKTVN